MEHWVDSHPDFQPCEVFSVDSNPKISYASKQAAVLSNATWNPVRTLAPGNKTFTDYWPLSVHPWSTLSGRLYEYNYLYSKVPPNTSWIYSFYLN